MRWLDGITYLMDMNFSKLQDIIQGRDVWHAAVHGLTVRCKLSIEQQPVGPCSFPLGLGASKMFFVPSKTEVSGSPGPVEVL